MLFDIFFFTWEQMAAWFSLNFRAEGPNHKELIQPQVGENTVQS